MGRRGVCCLAVLLCLTGITSVAGATGDGWEQVQVRVLTFHYRTHDGFRRSAYVVVPDWYGPHRNPAIPLIISPHGRGVSALENVKRWDNLPAFGSFAVVNPEGRGRRLARFSWGYTGQVDDLARMPKLVARAFPWLRIDRSRIFSDSTLAA